MDFSWIGDVFSGILKIFSPLKAVAHWAIWGDLKAIWLHLKAWRDWYRKHVLAQMQALQALERQIFNTWIRPVLNIIDTIRRMTGAIGIFNKALANRLNLMFLRVEGYILEPFNLLISKINKIQNEFTAFLTPLGYFDRATSLNSLWRDFGHLKTLLENPFGSPQIIGSLAPTPPFDQQVKYLTDYATGAASPIAQSIDPQMSYFLNLIGEPTS